jgi:hypothetical protein
MVWGPNPQFSPLDVNDTPKDDKMKLMSFVSVAFFSIPQIYGKGINHTNKILFFLLSRLEYTLQALLVPALYPLIVIRYGNTKVLKRFHIKK